MKRIFAAIKILPSENFISVIYQLKNALRTESIKWVEPHNIHITLKFFGETEESRIGEIITQLTQVANAHKPFKFSVRGSGVFGSSYDPRVIWLGIDHSLELQKLSSDVLDSLAAIGWKKDRQNFVPHLTVGRIKHISDKPKLKEVIKKFENFEIQMVATNAFYLYESILKPTGPVYHVLETFGLK
jgi:RNA 2',3'-cyclic 3'-phosphodiesterase